MKPRFETKVDWWVGLLLLLAPIGSVVSGAAVIMHGAIIQGLVPMLFVAALYVGLVYPIAYELDDDALVIRFGLMRSRIAYKDIKSVKPTRNPLSSPALSMDRLHINAGSSLGPNISPADRAGFLKALAEKTPHLKLEGEELRPA